MHASELQQCLSSRSHDDRWARRCWLAHAYLTSGACNHRWTRRGAGRAEDERMAVAIAKARSVGLWAWAVPRRGAQLAPQAKFHRALSHTVEQSPALRKLMRDSKLHIRQVLHVVGASSYDSLGHGHRPRAHTGRSAGRRVRLQTATVSAPQRQIGFKQEMGHTLRIESIDIQYTQSLVGSIHMRTPADTAIYTDMGRRPPRPHSTNKGGSEDRSRRRTNGTRFSLPFEKKTQPTQGEGEPIHHSHAEVFQINPPQFRPPFSRNTRT